MPLERRSLFLPLLVNLAVPRGYCAPQSPAVSRRPCRPCCSPRGPLASPRARRGGRWGRPPARPRGVAHAQRAPRHAHCRGRGERDAVWRRCPAALGSPRLPSAPRARLPSVRTMRRRAAACLRALCLLLHLRAAGERGRPRPDGGAGGTAVGTHLRPAAHLLGGRREAEAARVRPAAARVRSPPAPEAAGAPVSTADSGGPGRAGEPRAARPAERPRFGPGSRGPGRGLRQRGEIGTPYFLLFLSSSSYFIYLFIFRYWWGGVATCMYSWQQWF